MNHIEIYVSHLIKNRELYDLLLPKLGYCIGSIRDGQLVLVIVKMSIILSLFKWLKSMLPSLITVAM